MAVESGPAIDCMHKYRTAACTDPQDMHRSSKITMDRLHQISAVVITCTGYDARREEGRGDDGRSIAHSEIGQPRVHGQQPPSGSSWRHFPLPPPHNTE